MKKIVIVNILFILLLIPIFEIISVFFAVGYRIQNLNDPTFMKRYREKNLVQYIFDSYKSFPVVSYNYGKTNLHPVVGNEFTKRPIVLFGCSISYGVLLDKTKNFSSILSKQTKRPVYNMSFNGWCPSHMLRLLQEDKRLLFLDNPEYIIYTFINDQKRRMFFYQGWRYNSQLYKLFELDKNDNLVLYPNKYPFYWRFMLIKHFQYALERVDYINEEKVDKLLFKIFEESVKIIKKRYPNSKLALLLYDVKLCSDDINVPIFKTEDILTKKEQEKFKELGFEIINMEELVGKSFCGDEYHAHCPIYGDVDPHHPSTKMWEEFVPKLVEKLKI